jgi:integrase
MAQVVQRTWRSGPRKVRKSAWGYTLQVDGKQERKYDASWTKEDAEKALAARLLNISTPVENQADVITFKTMTDRYLKEKEVSGKQTLCNDRAAVARFLAHFGPSTPLTEITAPKIATYRLARLTTLSERTGRRVAPRTVNVDLAILKAILRMAASDECAYLEKAPRIRLEKEPQGRLRFLTEDEASRLLEECRRAAEHPVRSTRCPHLYAQVVVAMHSGMRRGEVRGLDWSRVDFSRGVLRLEMTKSGRRREIPMNRAIYDALSALPRTGTKVFPTTGRTAFLGAVDRAGLKDFRFHDLRHTFASQLVMRGRPLKEVQELLGHSSVRMTERYSHLSPERLRDAVATLENFSTTSAQRPSQPTPALATTRQD